jgi:hypothetical protein
VALGAAAGAAASGGGGDGGGDSSGDQSECFVANGVYYMPQMYNGEVVYVAVPPPSQQ